MACDARVCRAHRRSGAPNMPACKRLALDEDENGGKMLSSRARTVHIVAFAKLFSSATIEPSLAGDALAVAVAHRSQWDRTAMRRERRRCSRDLRQGSARPQAGCPRTTPNCAPVTVSASTCSIRATTFSPRPPTCVTCATALARPGFLAAYHAGSTHYDEYLTNGWPLPEKSRR
jgi:hypothetical protein